jgi:lysine-N-methylase
MASGLPIRPRLAPHVLPRRHIVDGDARVVLHDIGSGRLVQIGVREWGLLAAADGTRDLTGILLAAAREGAHARAAALEQFLEQLHALGMLEDGAEDQDAAARAPAPAPESDRDDVSRPLDPLAGFSLSCDGSGSCCRLYASIVFGPVEAARARALLPQVLGGGERHERVFMPERGSGPTGGSIVTLCDGRCAYLASSGRCAVHEAGGAAAKPIGCATFPATFTDDGEAVRVSVAVECACVLASADREGGAPLLPPGLRVRADLHETLSVSRVPDLVAVSPAGMAPRAELRTWARRVISCLPAAGDTAAALVALGALVAQEGLSADPRAALGAPPPIAPATVTPWIEALHRHAARRAREDAAWRSERDLARRASSWIAAVTEVLGDPAALAATLGASVPSPRAEAFYVRALVHGHHLATGRLPISLALHDRAVRLLVARAMYVFFATLPPEALDPACAEPLALLEAMLRGHGLDAYAHDVAAEAGG